jgi:hypothetical protein
VFDLAAAQYREAAARPRAGLSRPRALARLARLLVDWARAHWPDEAEAEDEGVGVGAGAAVVPVARLTAPATAGARPAKVPRGGRGADAAAAATTASAAPPPAAPDAPSTWSRAQLLDTAAAALSAAQRDAPDGAWADEPAVAAARAWLAQQRR